MSVTRVYSAKMDDNFEACDPQTLLTNKQTEADFVLDGKHFGRGHTYVSNYSNTIHRFEPTDVKCWRVREDTLVPVADRSIGHFFNHHNYVVSVEYKENVFEQQTEKLLREESTRVCFYWKGANASKGYSPLPDELSNEDTPVERIFQWSEIPVFLRLFKGFMVVHNRKFDDGTEGPRLYIARGSFEDELHYFEVPNQESSLRSRTSFILVHEDSVYIWHGCKSSNRNLVTKKIDKKWLDFWGAGSSQIKEVEEGDESEEFRTLLNVQRSSYCSLLKNPNTFDYSPKLFYFTSITTNFLAVEVKYPLNSALTDPFPFLQDHLYTASQPGLFLLDNIHELWLWQGWKPEEFAEEGAKKFEAERRATVTTAVNYCDAKFPNQSEVIRVIRAGGEPLEFINLFPYWVHKPEVVKLQIEYSQDDTNRFEIH